MTAFFDLEDVGVGCEFRWIVIAITDADSECAIGAESRYTTIGAVYMHCVVLLLLAI